MSTEDILDCLLLFLLLIESSSLRFPFHFESALFLPATVIFSFMSLPIVFRSTFFLGVFLTVKVYPLLSPLEEINEMSLLKTSLLVENSPTSRTNPLISLEYFHFFNIFSKASLLPSNWILTLSLSWHFSNFTDNFVTSSFIF